MIWMIWAIMYIYIFFDNYETHDFDILPIFFQIWPQIGCLVASGVELYPAQEEAILEIFSGAHVVPRLVPCDPTQLCLYPGCL